MQNFKFISCSIFILTFCSIQAMEMIQIDPKEYLNPRNEDFLDKLTQLGVVKQLNISTEDSILSTDPTLKKRICLRKNKSIKYSICITHKPCSKIGKDIISLSSSIDKISGTLDPYNKVVFKCPWCSFWLFKNSCIRENMKLHLIKKHFKDDIKKNPLVDQKLFESYLNVRNILHNKCPITTCNFKSGKTLCLNKHFPTHFYFKKD